MTFQNYRGEVSGYIKAAYDRSQIANRLDKLLRNVIIFSIIGVLIVLIIIFLVARKIFDPLEEFEGMFASLALGNLKVSYPIKTVNCSEIMDCGIESCPDFERDGVTCWFDVGSYAPEFGKEVHCPKIKTGEYEDCTECEVYQQVNKNEIEKLGAWFNKFADVLRDLIRDIVSMSGNLAASSQELTATGEELSASAEEIRELAEQSSKATEDIAKLIKSIQKDVEKAVENMDENESAVEESVEAIDKTSSSFNSITTQADELESLIKNIRGEVERMNQNSVNVKEAVDEISAVSETAAANAEEVAASSQEQAASTQTVVDASEELVNMVERLNKIVDQFDFDK